MVINKESTPPPMIGKAGRYTVFITPPATPKPSSETKSPPPPTTTPKPSSGSKSPSTPKPSFETKSDSPKIHSPTKIVPPVQPPPQQFEKLNSGLSSSDSSVFGFFWNAVAKVQNAHSSLDEYLADWFGLNHSKYQWALDDYYESQGTLSTANVILAEQIEILFIGY
ncbi:hypothetical protein BVC80_9081g106 [Macleaya cordata]|uniref:Uncharacterized protein n=1 Tax=Macleaya cordata TaxID=56857 RepID=A0A200PRU9_MACCD|nr:hypothetical protein BVC80_9081g106 [Macleaya cordata]